jgi:K+ transporter
MPLCTGVTGLRSKTLLAVVLSVLGLALLVWLAYRGWSILLLAPGAAIGREKLRQRPRPRHKGWWRWRDAPFILMSNNTLDATEFFRIPPNRGVELGGQIEI